MEMVKTVSFNLATYSQGDKNAKKFALVLPGKCDSKDYAHMHAHVEFLASKGFFALSFDPPGTWESEGDIRLYTMTNYLKAIDELIESHGNKPTFLVAHSRGGKMAMIAASANPLVVAYASVMSSFSTKDEIQEVDVEWKAKGYEETFRSLPPGTGPRIKPFRLPYSFYEDQKKYFLTDEIKACTKPKLFVAGKKDTIAPAEKVRATFAAMAGPKELHEVDSDHDYWHYPEIIAEVQRLLGTFLDTNVL